MKRVLLGSTALLSAALLSHGAMAQTAPSTTDQPVKLGISGFFQGGYMANLSESGTPPGSPSGSNKHLPDAVQQYGLLDFSGDTKFSNGLGAGAFIELQTYSGSTIHQAWGHITGDSFGEIRVGDETDVVRARAVAAPEFAPDTMFSVNSPNMGINNGAVVSNSTTSWFGASKYPTQIAWFSPTFSGFSLAVSYAPDTQHGLTGPAPTGLFNDSSVTNFRDQIAVSGTWAGNVGKVALSADLGFATAAVKQNTFDTTGIEASDNGYMYHAGLSGTYGPWAVGGAYEQVMGAAPQSLNNIGLPSGTAVAGEVNKTFDFGVTYAIGAVTTGAEISRGSYKIPFLGGAPKLNQAIAGASYLIGPGVTVTGGIQFNDYDNANTQNLTTGVPGGYDSISLLMGTDIKF